MDIRALLDEIYQRLDRSEALAELKPKGRAGYLELECPQCKERRAFIYANGVTLKCNRLNECGYSSTLWDYIQTTRGLRTNREVLEELAKLAEYPLPKLEGFSEEKYQEEREKESLLEAALGYFKAELFTEKGLSVLGYLKERGYSEDEIKGMELGFCPSPKELKDYLVNKVYSVNALNNSGLLTQGFGETYTLAIPHRDHVGRLGGFVLRAIDKEIKPKYKNSYGLRPSLQFFNMDRAKGEDTLVVVEGYLDALIATQREIRGVVAVGKAIPSETQIDHAIKSGAKRFVFALDNDKEAGEKGTEAALKLLNEKGISGFVVTLPEGHKDPDELMRDKGKEAFVEVLESAESGAKWKAKRLLSKHSKQGLQDIQRDEAIEEALSYEETIQDPIASVDFLDTISEALDISPKVLRVKATDYREKLGKEKQLRGYHEALIKSGKLLQEGKVGELEGYLREALPSIKAKSVARILEPYPFSSLEYDIRSTRAGLKTGYAELDEFVTIPQEAITIIAGRPSHGKTTLLLNMFLNMVENYKDKRFYFFSYEETKKQLALKCLNILGNKQLHEYKNNQALEAYLREGRKDEAEIERAKRDYQDKVESGRLWLIDEPYYIDGLSETIRYLRDRYDNIGAIFVDYIQKIKIAGRHATRQLELQKISEEILETAKASHLPIILGCQFNREVNEEKDVTLSKLRESGDIEQDSNLVLGLYNGAMQTAEKDNTPFIETEVELTIKILKNRNGAVNKKINLDFTTPTLRIETAKGSGI